MGLRFLPTARSTICNAGAAVRSRTSGLLCKQVTG